MMKKMMRGGKLNFKLFKIKDREKIANHQKFFTKNECLSRWWSAAALVSLLLGGSLIYLDLPKKFKLESLMLAGLVLVALSFALALALALQQRKNLKGVPVDVQADLKPDVHYEVVKIVEENSVEMGLSELAVKYPPKASLEPLAYDWPIRQMAKQHGIKYEAGLVFGIKKDGTFFFVHNQPKENGGEADEKPLPRTE